MAREFASGMGQAVAERTILRKKEDGTWENWADVAERVSVGNALLSPDPAEVEPERRALLKHLQKVTITMSGRHLQHGDSEQPNFSQEKYTNCATSSTSFSLFLLLMSGSGVGRAYDDDLMVIDWDYSPNLRCVLSESHPDFDHNNHESVRDALHKYKDAVWHKVGDTREGWAKAVEVYERMTYEKTNKDKFLILDFSNVRRKGEPIKGMQNRPASGPVPLMHAFMKVASLKGAGMQPWRQAMYSDHFFAECVLVGGARRAARMSTKTWRDKSVLDFIRVKRPLEFDGKSLEEVIDLRKNGYFQSFLWSSNDSVTVDGEFWKLVNSPEDVSELARHARAVFDAVTECSYGDGTGEPGLINQDQLVDCRDGFDEMLSDPRFIDSGRYRLDEETLPYMKNIIDVVRQKKLVMIVNPCSEVPLFLMGGFCIIGDACPFFADTLDEAEEGFRALTRALIRVNMMDSIYKKEVLRTNRIGVAITGIHEFAWKFFKFDFYDLIDEEKSKDFWLALARFNGAVKDEARKYCKRHGLVVPHTSLIIKPAGTTSKLWGLTEGWHLPAMAWYLRWVQFSINDPLVKQYESCGYPTRILKQYKNTAIVGFPTEPLICGLGLKRLVLAAQATPEEQYKWLLLGEKYWIKGIDGDDRGGQISFTLKYNPEKVDFAHFKEMMLRYQSRVRCCSVMPQESNASYEYLPEEAISHEEFLGIKERIAVRTELYNGGKKVAEDINLTHIQCDGGACPVDFNDKK